jgi:alkylation response protein AidB-like acyl-CoA dehydrogenase
VDHQARPLLALGCRTLHTASVPIARAYAAGQMNEIYGGTSEIMKEIISRSL